MKVKKNWSDYVTKHSIALDLEEGVFTWNNPQRIAKSLKLSAENSLRRKATPFQSVMSMLNFYINRAGKNLPPKRKKILEQAKIELRKAFTNYFVYILRTSKNTLYIGQTNNLEKRIQEHKNKSSKSAKYIRYFSDFELVYFEKYLTRKKAVQREAQLKRWPKAKKEALIDQCIQCGLCCRLFLVNLTKNEYQSGKYKTQFEKFGLMDDFHKAASCGANTLKQKEDGSCVYLKRNKCSVHKTRPQVCREFFCTSKLKKFKKMIEQIKMDERNNIFCGKITV